MAMGATPFRPREASARMLVHGSQRVCAGMTLRRFGRMEARTLMHRTIRRMMPTGMAMARPMPVMVGMEMSAGYPFMPMTSQPMLADDPMPRRMGAMMAVGPMMMPPRPGAVRPVRVTRGKAVTMR